MQNTKELSDEQIAELVQNGNKNIYKKLVIKYEPKIRSYLGYLLGSNEHVDDIIQETFINAYVNINAFNISKKFSSWIYRIAHNKAMDYVRKHSKLRINVEFDILENILYSRETPENDYQKEETAKKVERCMQELPLKYREILSLFYIEDKSYEEVRDILQINMNNIAVRINRGKKLLKDICVKGGTND